MFVSVGRIWAGRPAAEEVRESRTRRWPWSHFELRTSVESLDVPAFYGASDAEVQERGKRSLNGVEAARHRAILLLYANPSRFIK